MARRRYSRTNGLGRTHCLASRRRHRYDEDEGFCGTNGWLTRPDSLRAPTYYLSRLQEEEMSYLEPCTPTQEQSPHDWFGVITMLLMAQLMWFAFSFDLVMVGPLSYLLLIIAFIFATLGMIRVYQQRWLGNQKSLEMPYDYVENGGLLPFDEGIPVANNDSENTNRKEMVQKRIPH